MSGYSSNYLVLTLMNQPLPALVNHCIALMASVLVIRTTGSRLSGILSQNESLAVSSTSFSGKIASITLGTATLNNPAEAVLTDEYHKKHYIMVMPCSEEESFRQGDDVVLIEQQQGFWTAIKFHNI
ncbi:YqiJ family protein [Endozoicomonas sp. Mp262]